MVVEMELAPPKEQEELVTTFANLKTGQRINTVAEITQIRYDEKNDPPTWVLYYLYDGTMTIRVFQNRILPFQVGDVIKVDITVSEGRPYKNKPQLAYRAVFMRQIRKEEPHYQKLTKHLQYKAILRKADMQELLEGTRIKFFTHVLDLNPANGNKEKFKKILVADVENKPISLWFPKECLPLFKSLEKEELFILKATVKRVEQNPAARYLVFETFAQGKEAYSDPVAQLFFEERIRYYSQELTSYLELWKITNAHRTDVNHESIDILRLILQSFRRDMYND